ncbi:unnamed protein product [Cuscuta campestris]|uniref:peroxidase n=1 Tax=Cuscuta campestris TaxID=132261 RepID=A0A484LCM6_9ASTE|nr:unnamed protein product [Cuscuta campestris]VFQ74110.1 unnamed protein product [Cuscuta campestris]
MLGRKDSRAAYKREADGLRTVFSSLKIIADKFAEIGLDATDLVALSGGHTIGRSQCRMFLPRLYNFNNTGKPDPEMNPAFLANLRTNCPNVTAASSNLNNLDATTADTFDNNYFKNLMNKKGLLATDQGLLSSLVPGTADLVSQFASDQNSFFKAFGKAMIKMGNFGVLDESQGEIRKNCRLVN